MPQFRIQKSPATLPCSVPLTIDLTALLPAYEDLLEGEFGEADDCFTVPALRFTGAFISTVPPLSGYASPWKRLGTMEIWWMM